MNNLLIKVKSFNKWGNVLLLFIALSAGIYAVSHVMNDNKETKEWVQERDRMKEKNDSLNVLADSVQEQVKKDSIEDKKVVNEVNDLRKKLSQERERRLALLSELNSSKECQELEECTQAVQIAYETQAANDSLELAASKLTNVIDRQIKNIALLNTTVDKLQIQNDSLVHLLNTAPLKKPDKFLGFIPLPTRTTALIVGIGAGALGTVALISAVN